MRSIYTIIQHVCVNDYIDYSFWGLAVGLVTLVGGTSLAVYLYFRTKKDTDDTIDKFANKIDNKPNSPTVLIAG